MGFVDKKKVQFDILFPWVISQMFQDLTNRMQNC